MSNYLIQSETLDNIANAINNITGESEALSPAQMASKLNGIEKYQWDIVIPPYLCFTAEEANAPIEMAGLPGAPSMNMEYSFDKSNWSTFEIGELDPDSYEVSSHGTVITLENIDDKVYFRGNNDHGFCVYDEDEGSSFCNEFIIRDKKMSVSGNIMTLMDKTGESTVLYENNFDKLFVDCYKLTNASKLELPVIQLAPYCYASMFANFSDSNSELTSAPELLPATTLADDCYEYMFSGCTSLTEAPELPATTLADYCYAGMFRGCTAIKLSATQTGEYQTPYRIPTSGTGTTATVALNNMFYGTGGSFTGTPSINTTYYGAW